MAVFSEAFLRLRQDLDQSHEGRRKLIQDIGADVRELARQTADQVTEQGRIRRAEFAAMIADLRGKIREQAEQTRGQLAELAGDLRHGGKAFRREKAPGPQGSRKR